MKKPWSQSYATLGMWQPKQSRVGLIGQEDRRVASAGWGWVGVDAVMLDGEAWQERHFAS